MSAWLRQHQQALAAALSRLPRLGGALSALVIGIALSLPAGGYVLLEGLRGVGARVTLAPQVSVFMRTEAKHADAEALGAALKADARVARVRFLPREQALKELAAVQGMAEVIAALGKNPLPDAYIVEAKDSAAGALDALAADLAKLPGVAHVQADSAWARRLASLAALLRSALWLLAAVLGVGLIAVTFNTVRLQILTQREEIEVLKLIGATDAFIRRPFYYLGLLQGLAGGAVALAIVGGTLALLNREVATLAASYGSSFRFTFPAAGDALAILGFAGLIGWLGAYLSVGRQLQALEG